MIAVHLEEYILRSTVGELTRMLILGPRMMRALSDDELNRQFLFKSLKVPILEGNT